MLPEINHLYPSYFPPIEPLQTTRKLAERLDLLDFI